MKNALPFVLLILACFGLSPRANAGTEAGAFGNGNAASFKAKLLAAITRADRIVVTEHSLASDLRDPKTYRPLSEDEIIYGSRELDDKERLSFAAIVSDLIEEPKDNPSLCIFAPHHTVRFFSRGENYAVMNICFGCGQITWGEGPVFNPRWLIPGLSVLVKQIGFEPKRDWRSLAEMHSPWLSAPGAVGPGG